MWEILDRDGNRISKTFFRDSAMKKAIKKGMINGDLYCITNGKVTFIVKQWRLESFFVVINLFRWIFKNQQGLIRINSYEDISNYDYRIWKNETNIKIYEVHKIRSINSEKNNF